MQERIVFLGDSITDGHTYLLLLRQSLDQAGRIVPVVINAGVSGDTALAMSQRLDRDVLVHRPTRVAISAGINDVRHSVPPAAYRSQMRGIIQALRQAEVPVLLMTPTVLGGKHAERNRLLQDYVAAIRELSCEYGCQIAEVHRDMAAAGDLAGLLEPDGIHINPAGYGVMTRSILDALGHRDVPVFPEVIAEPMPGVVPSWRVRPMRAGEARLAGVAQLQADGEWHDIKLPLDTAEEHWWLDQERRRGFAVSLSRRLGQGERFAGIASVLASRNRRVFFNTGAKLQGLWLNGTCLYRSEQWTGWHAGRQRIEARLQPGENRIAIETQDSFFLSITETNDW